MIRRTRGGVSLFWGVIKTRLTATTSKGVEREEGLEFFILSLGTRLMHSRGNYKSVSRGGATWGQFHKVPVVSTKNKPSE